MIIKLDSETNNRPRLTECHAQATIAQRTCVLWFACGLSVSPSIPVLKAWSSWCWCWMADPIRKRWGQGNVTLGRDHYNFGGTLISSWERRCYKKLRWSWISLSSCLASFLSMFQSFRCCCSLLWFYQCVLALSDIQLFVNGNIQYEVFCASFI